jgi:hypothetical protein
VPNQKMVMMKRNNTALKIMSYRLALIIYKKLTIFNFRESKKEKEKQARQFSYLKSTSSSNMRKKRRINLE